MTKKFSGKQVSRTGEAFLEYDALKEDPEKFETHMNVLSYWRFSHESSLEIAFKKIQITTLQIDKNAIFAKRLKRYISIINKLNRFRKMKLKNMQDIGGCRIILANKKKLNQTARLLKKMPEFKINGKFRTKNYIKKPKDDGYRSLHIVGKFPDLDEGTKSIEIQLRTSMQHYWATALEIVDIFTNQALKSNQGDAVWKSFFKNVAFQFSIIDDIHLFNTLSTQEKYNKYYELAKSNPDILTSCKLIKDHCDHLDIFNNFDAFSNSLQIADKRLEEQEDSEFVLLKINTSTTTVYSAPRCFQWVMVENTL